jgi:hypothetical protein
MIKIKRAAREVLPFFLASCLQVFDTLAGRFFPVAAKKGF